MKKMLVAWLVSLLPAVVLAQESVQKPEVPVEKWTAKTIMLIGAMRTMTPCRMARWRCFRRTETRFTL